MSKNTYIFTPNRKKYLKINNNKILNMLLEKANFTNPIVVGWSVLGLGESSIFD